jgi:5S rRNA maturation endonuclease (ribonuclease M5)
MRASDIKNSYTLSDVIRKYVDLKRDGNEFVGCCPFHGERTPSFRVQDARRSWHCFGCGEHGDVVDFVQKMEKCTLHDACEKITGTNFTATGIEKRELPPIVDIYADLISIPIKECDIPRANQWFSVWNPKSSPEHPNGRFTRYRPTLIHPYRNFDGELVGCTVRINMKDRKIVPMLRMIEKNKQRSWCHFPFEKPRSPYGVDQLKINETSTVLIVEGEKCVDTARLVIGSPCITWAGGTNAVKFTDWSALKNRNVLLWADADSQGREAMLEVFDSAISAGASKIKLLNEDISKPKGWDIADAVDIDKMSRADILAWMTAQMPSKFYGGE